jgi:hypothetical protein
MIDGKFVSVKKFLRCRSGDPVRKTDLLSWHATGPKEKPKAAMPRRTPKKIPIQVKLLATSAGADELQKALLVCHVMGKMF